MSDLRRATVRFAVAAGTVLLGVLEVQNLMSAALAAGRTRARHLRVIERAFDHARPAVAGALALGAEGHASALRLASTPFPGAEAELFDLRGQRIAAAPGPSPVAEAWPAASRLIPGGPLLLSGPLAGPPARLHLYATQGAPQGLVVLRLAVPVADLMEDLAEWRAQLLTHGVAILALALAAGLALFPGTSGAARSRELDAVEVAIDRLRERGERAEQRWRDAGSLARAGELTAGMAHELRNGLATVLGYARLAERTHSLDEARHLAGEIRRESDSLAAVVTRFVELVRDDRLVLSEVDVDTLLARVAARAAELRPEISVVPRVSPGLRVQADEGLIERALENLVRNAVQAAGGQVVLYGRQSGEWAELVVEDDGPGMPEEARRQPKPFASGRPGGLGLGLPLVAKLAGLHGGQLRLDAVAPHGLRAALRLPAAVP